MSQAQFNSSTTKVDNLICENARITLNYIRTNPFGNNSKKKLENEEIKWEGKKMVMVMMMLGMCDLG